MPSKLVKENSDILLPIITRIINLSLQLGMFIEDWKVSIVRPLLKKLGLELINKNYRPVSNLSFLSKLVEKGGLGQFCDYAELERLFPDYMSAYRQG